MTDPDLITTYFEEAVFGVMAVLFLPLLIALAVVVFPFWVIGHLIERIGR